MINTKNTFREDDGTTIDTHDIKCNAQLMDRSLWQQVSGKILNPFLHHKKSKTTDIKSSLNNDTFVLQQLLPGASSSM